MSPENRNIDVTGRSYAKKLAVISEKDLYNLDPKKLSPGDSAWIKNARERIGQEFISKQGYKVRIVWYMGKDCTIIEFVDVPIPYTCTVSMNNLRKGHVPNYPYAPNMHNGYFGVGGYSQTRNRKVYNIWFSMLTRCDSDYIKSHNVNNSYLNVSICDEWRNFQVFADWYYGYILGLNQDQSIEYQIDKDLFQLGCENKIYSPQTCCIIPKDLNNSLQCLIPDDRHISYDKDNEYSRRIREAELKQFQIYIQGKREKIRRLADHYFSINAIYKYVYDAFYNI